LLGLRTTSELETNLREHSPPSSDGFGHKLLGRLLNFEISRLERGSTIPFGGSCLVVARRS
ncbi:MAG: hypothetical protein KDD53_12315, partial [Bdellovibrionales bacterium]|nr:hypothetical protein [Bdellovibrionales bacterium]